ncbi:MAG: hypothetical protein DHS20C18_54350 [Saprospiraceae bacterium]|nr:MAG: hypothetical protein DHS20C18_54350 [Saprospiraceae bacterium]
MKVLFIVSGNSAFYKIAPFIKSQGDSLQEEGVDLSYFLILGKGWLNYYKNIAKLTEFLAENPVDLLHAHYSLCGLVAILAAGKLPVVLSLMGSDTQRKFKGSLFTRLQGRMFYYITVLVQFFVKAIIYKSPNLKKAVYRKKIAHLVPNGVNLEHFKISSHHYREELGLRQDKRYVLFLGNPNDVNKNYVLIEKAVARLNRPDLVLLNRFDLPHEEVAKYLNAVDVVTLCSFSEGSPNVIKEAMSCGCPLVSTNVGDVAWVANGMPGNYIASFEPEDFAAKLSQALEFAEKYGRTAGRQRILDLELDTQSVAHRIINIYNRILPPGKSNPITTVKKMKQIGL